MPTIVRSSIFETLERRRLASSGPVNTVVNLPSSLTGISLAQSPTVSQGVKVYAWDQPRDASSFNAAIRAAVYNDPIQEAHQVGPLLAARDPGDRALLLWAAFDDTYAKMDLDHPAGFIGGGLDIAHDLQWATAFFGELKSMEVPLERVSLDIEINFSTWCMLRGSSDSNIALMQSIYNDPDSYAKLPPEVKAFSPEDFGSFHNPTGAAAYNAWNQWARSVMQSAIKTAIYDPIHQIYGSSILTGNYGDVALQRPTTDKNGWLLGNTDQNVPGNISAPESYLWNGNKFIACQKDWRWNRMIDALNTVRACLNAPDVTVTPWVSFPSYRGDGVANAKSTWLWEQMIRHMSASGVSSFNYFNPTGATTRADDLFADRLFKALTVGVTDSQSTQPLSPDADSITTGGFTTTYADFLKYVDQPGATNLPGAVTPQTPPPVVIPASLGQNVTAKLKSRALTIVGTGHNDVIQLKESGSNIVVVANGIKIGSFNGVKTISIDGGKGADLVKIDLKSLLVRTTVFGGAGNDTIRSSAAADYINGNAGDDNISSSGGNDTIYGNEGSDTLDGGDGNDQIFGDAGIDSLTGGTGADTLTGGSGNDFLIGGKGIDLALTEDKDILTTIESAKAKKTS